jgi:hypothetical protein
MSDLNVSNDIFSENVSRDFKNKIAQKKIAIPNYSRAQLLQEKEHLDFRKYLMNDKLETGDLSEHQKTIYEIYLKDVNDLINAIDARLLEGGTRKSRRRRRKSIRKSSIRRRKSIRKSSIRRRQGIKRRTRK